MHRSAVKAEGGGCVPPMPALQPTPTGHREATSWAWYRLCSLKTESRSKRHQSSVSLNLPSKYHK